MQPSNQLVLQPGYGPRPHRQKFALSCESGEDRFQKCILPLVSLVPAFIALCVLVIRASCPVLRRRPQWMKPFIEELDEQGEEIQSSGKKHMRRTTVALLVTAPVGLFLQVVSTLYPVYSAPAIFPTLAWVNCLYPPKESLLISTFRL